MKRFPPAKHNIGNDDIEAVTKALKSRHLSDGPANLEFEKMFAKKIGAKYATAVSSGTAGLHLALIAAGVKPGDEVITSTFSFIASANCIAYIGAKPIFVDIDPDTYNMDPKKIEEKITKKTKAILAVHIFGQAAEMDPIMKIAKKHNLKVIEDACESVMATYKGKKVGNFGETAVFAFFPNKQMTTAEGGIIVTNDKKKDRLFRSLRSQGWNRDIRKLDYHLLGYNYRMDELSASLGVSQLKKLNRFIAERKKIIGWYNKYLKNYPELLQLPATHKDNTHTWFVYIVRLKSKKLHRDKVIKKLGQRGVGSKPYFHPIHSYKYYRDTYGYKQSDYPIAEAVGKSTLSLPLYVGLKENDVKEISKQLIKVVKEN